MPITITQAKERIQRSEKKTELDAILKHDARLKLHGEPVLDRYDSGPAFNRFLRWVGDVLTADKAAVFEHLLTFPVLTVELVEQIMGDLEKVFDGKNPVFRYEFTDKKLISDWFEYKVKLGYPSFWRVNGMQALKTMVNSVVVVDLPQQQTTGAAEPYFYFVDPCNILDFEDQDGNLSVIIFKLDGRRAAVYDEQFYRIFEIPESGGEPVLILENPHELGECPGHWFWDNSISKARRWFKKSPITTTLGHLDWYLFFKTSKRHLDLYAPYPIVSGYEEDCSYESEESGLVLHCESGFLVDSAGLSFRRNNSRVPCPSCSGKKIYGAGSFVTIPLPDKKAGIPDLRNPIQLTGADTPSLEYNVSETERLRNEIYKSVTGYAGEPVNDQAINEKQVYASFESRTAILRNIKINFELVQARTERKICKLRYGRMFTGLSINYGTEFYLESADTLLKLYNDQLAAGSGDVVTLDYLQEQYYETKFRNNPEQLERAKLVNAIDPARHNGPDKSEALYKAGVLSEADAKVKANFASYLMRFETENANIQDFGVNLEFAKRVNTIKEALRAYAEEVEKVEDDPGPEGIPKPAGSN